MTVLVIKGDYGEDYLQLSLGDLLTTAVHRYNVLGAL